MSRITFLSTALLASLLWPSGADARGSENTWVRATALAPSCTLDVVLVTFQDETETTAGEDCHYCNHDRPYGTNSGQSADFSYTLRDFERLFSGGYGSLAPLVGDTVTVAISDTLPEVFGSVKAYYDSMSLDPKDRTRGVTSGKFQLHVRLINAANGDYPRWIELLRTKAHYARIDWNDPRRGNRFWDEAYAAAWDSVRCWNPNEIPNVTDPPNCGASVAGYTIDDIPNDSYSLDRRRRHKVVYLYSGPAFTRRDPPGLLHPQVDQITATNPMDSTQVGYRYATGERVGLGGTNHSLDRFASIGFHVHEIGHLLGLRHGEGRWEGENPHMPRRALLDTNAAGANFVNWGIMQGGSEGPEVVGDGYHKGYGSCPVPINPFYRMDLGWLTPTKITENKEDYVFDPGWVHLIDAGTHTVRTARDTLLLERRSNNGFGRYISFYEYANKDPGLLIWRRDHSEIPLLIVADGRRIRNSRDQEKDYSPSDTITVHEYQDQLSDPFPVPANVYTSHGQHDSYAQPVVNAIYAHTPDAGLRQQTQWNNTRNRKSDPGNLGVAITDITRGVNDTLTADVQLNYWAGAIAGPTGGSITTPTREVWGDGVPEWDVGTVYVAGDLTVPEGARLTITPGTVVEFGPGEPAGSYRNKPNLIVYGTLDARNVTFTSAEAGLDWGGLVVYGDTTNYTTNSVLTGCTIENASFGVRMRTVGWTLGGNEISDGNTFRNCSYGIYVTGSSSGTENYGRNNVIRNNTFVDCPTAVLVAHAPGTTVQQNLVTDSDNYGIRVVGSGSSDALVVNNTLAAGTGGGRGVYFSSASAGTLRSSIATGFPNAGASAGGTASLTLDYYLGHDNGSDELSGTQDSTRRALLSAPKFTNTARSDYTLQADSPALDLGDPEASGLHADDGDRIDLGRFGGTAQAGTATGRLAIIEDYFYKGQASDWTKASGTSGTWSGDRAQGTYKVTGANGISRAYKSVDGSAYTLETRVKFGGAEGKVIYMQADQNESYRIDLLAVNDRVRLMVNSNAQAGGSFTIDSNEWYTVRVEVKDQQVSVWVNGSLIHRNVSTETTPDGKVGIGSYGGIHQAEFDYFLAMNAGGSSSTTPAPPGGSNFLVQDAFDDGSDSGWGVHSGTWSESGGLRKVEDLNGEGVSYLNTSFTSNHYTIKARLRMGSWEGKVVYRNADEGGGKRVDLMTNTNTVRVISDASNSFSRTLNTNQWYVCEVEVNANDDQVSVWIDGQAANANVPMTGTPNGYVGLGSYGPDHTTEFDYIQVRAGARSAKALALMEVMAAPVALANFPNPFNPATTMRYQVKKNGAVKLVVYNVLGQAVRTLVDEVQEPGAHRVMWDGRDENGRQVVSGVYM